ncbi:MAG: CvpA family protein [Candidatus Omnitrophica bacterium]|nr:CvpA family protein [Candidatus Omnitrophota bacterium]
MAGLLHKINWVDIVLLVCFIRICLVAAKNGLPTEFFKFLGTVVATYISFHYFKPAAAFLEKTLSLNTKDTLVATSADILSFLALAIAGYLVVLILRLAFARLIQMEAHPGFDKWGALALGVLRGILFSSLFISLLLFMNVNYFKESVNNSLSGKRIFRVAPGTHNFIWNHLLSKF